MRVCVALSSHMTLTFAFHPSPAALRSAALALVELRAAAAEAADDDVRLSWEDAPLQADGAAPSALKAMQAALKQERRASEGEQVTLFLRLQREEKAAAAASPARAASASSAYAPMTLLELSEDQQLRIAQEAVLMAGCSAAVRRALAIDDTLAAELRWGLQSESDDDDAHDGDGERSGDDGDGCPFATAALQLRLLKRKLERDFHSAEQFSQWRERRCALLAAAWQQQLKQGRRDADVEVRAAVDWSEEAEALTADLAALATSPAHGDVAAPLLAVSERCAHLARLLPTAVAHAGGSKLLHELYTRVVSACTDAAMDSRTSAAQLYSLRAALRLGDFEHALALALAMLTAALAPTPPDVFALPGVLLDCPFYPGIMPLLRPQRAGSAAHSMQLFAARRMRQQLRSTLLAYADNFDYAGSAGSRAEDALAATLRMYDAACCLLRCPGSPGDYDVQSARDSVDSDGQPTPAALYAAYKQLYGKRTAELVLVRLKHDGAAAMRGMHVHALLLAALTARYDDITRLWARPWSADGAHTATTAVLADELPKQLDRFIPHFAAVAGDGCVELALFALTHALAADLQLVMASVALTSQLAALLALLAEAQRAVADRVGVSRLPQLERLLHPLYPPIVERWAAVQRDALCDFVVAAMQADALRLEAPLAADTAVTSSAVDLLSRLEAGLPTLLALAFPRPFFVTLLQGFVAAVNEAVAAYAALLSKPAKQLMSAVLLAPPPPLAPAPKRAVSIGDGAFAALSARQAGLLAALQLEELLLRLNNAAFVMARLPQLEPAICDELRRRGIDDVDEALFSPALSALQHAQAALIAFTASKVATYDCADVLIDGLYLPHVTAGDAGGWEPAMDSLAPALATVHAAVRPPNRRRLLRAICSQVAGLWERLLLHSGGSRLLRLSDAAQLAADLRSVTDLFVCRDEDGTVHGLSQPFVQRSLHRVQRLHDLLAMGSVAELKRTYAAAPEEDGGGVPVGTTRDSLRYDVLLLLAALDDAEARKYVKQQLRGSSARKLEAEAMERAEEQAGKTRGDEPGLVAPPPPKSKTCVIS
eukprot:PLAT12373.1.p1 GENE.PLAT12373.1~~PLAT12373.1.p1  ORF type:complete len:1057 (+),score=613.97 PLAT12373.1:24-3194(+)